jgi:hypothetical protein
LPVYGQDDLVVPILDLLAQAPNGLTTTDLIQMLWERLTPTGENAEPSPSRPGERKFDQIVRNTTGPERHRLPGLVAYGGPGQPMTIAEATGFGAPYRLVDPTAPVTPRAPITVDPDVLDRGTTEHKRTQTAVSGALRGHGIEPLSPSAGDPDFDVGWRIGETWFVGEVKSLTAANEATQVRLGIAQLLEYRHVLARRHPTVRAVLVLERQPDLARWSDLLQSLAIDVVWPETLDPYLARLTETDG